VKFKYLVSLAKHIYDLIENGRARVHNIVLSNNKVHLMKKKWYSYYNS
jgi:hypothetical protein